MIVQKIPRKIWLKTLVEQITCTFIGVILFCMFLPPLMLDGLVPATLNFPFAAIFIASWITQRRKRELRILTRETLAIHREGARRRFKKRRDCIGIAGQGAELIFRDGSRMKIAAEGLSEKSNEAFLKRFYALWWPELNVDAVRNHLTETAPKQPLLLMIAEALLLALILIGGGAVAYYWGMYPLFVFLGGAALLVLLLLPYEKPYREACWAHRWELPDALQKGQDRSPVVSSIVGPSNA